MKKLLPILLLVTGCGKVVEAAPAQMPPVFTQVGSRGFGVNFVLDPPAGAAKYSASDIFNLCLHPPANQTCDATHLSSMTRGDLTYIPGGPPNTPKFEVVSRPVWMLEWDNQGCPMPVTATERCDNFAFVDANTSQAIFSYSHELHL